MPKRPDVPQTVDGMVRRLCFLLERMSGRGLSYESVFVRALDVCTAALGKLAGDDSDRWTWQPSGPEGDRPELSEFFALVLVAAVDRDTGAPTYEDVIGEVYMEFGRGRPHLGQYFTPTPLARVLARMTLASADLTAYTPARPMRICDPCVGSGRLLLGVAAELPRDFVVDGRAAFFGQDLDPVCVKMARFNARLYGLQGERAAATLTRGLDTSVDTSRQLSLDL